MLPRISVLRLFLLAACFSRAALCRPATPLHPSLLQGGRAPLSPQPPRASSPSSSSSTSSSSTSSSSFPRELAAVLVALGAARTVTRDAQPRARSLPATPVEEVDGVLMMERNDEEDEDEEEEERRRAMRAEEPPLSLDLTFHILREMLHMARVEQLSNQADFNRKMMENIGK